MLNVLLVIHLIACIALVIAVLLQRSEGGALGMGGGGAGGGLISGRGAANVLVRTTMGLAAVFFSTSILMTRLNAENARAPTELERQLQQQTTDPFSIPATPAPGATTTTSPAATTPPATTTPDPLAPSTPPASTPAPAPSGTTTPPAQSTAPARPTPAPTQPAPAQDPLAPAQNQ